MGERVAARPTGAAVGRVVRRCARATRVRRAPAAGAAEPARRAQGRPRRGARRRRAGLARGVPAGRRRGRRDRRRPGRPEHQRRLRLHPPRPAARPPCVEHGADLGIAHDGDADRCLAVDDTGAEVDGDQIMAVLALALQERGALRARHPRRDRDEQPRPPAGDGARGHPAAADRGRRPVRAGGDARGRLRARRRAVRARHHARPRHHRRRHAHRPACWRPGSRRPAARSPTSPP